MHEVIVRNSFETVEEIFHEGGPVAAVALRRCVAGSVIKNPFAGRYVEEITTFSEALKPLGSRMAKRLIWILGGCPRTMIYCGRGLSASYYDQYR